MNQKSSISWFNPRQMDDDIILALSTGQSNLLSAFERAIEIRVKNKVASKHWLVTGTRGAGKSFFLRSVQTLQPKWQALNVTYVLMPEELRNIFAPHEFLDEVRHLLTDEEDGSEDFGAAAAWRQNDADEAWQSALTALLSATDSDLIVIGVENFDQLLNRAFDSDANGSKLRRLLENEPRIMLLASAVDSSFDENYDNRLFCQFEQHPIMAWSPQAHRDYLTRRAAVEDLLPDANQLARIDAYSRFTGGNARVAAVLASLLLERQDPLDASADLENVLDKMTDYYRALLDRIPDKSIKLFDALIRGGEPCSQTELAQRVAASQSEIARAFIWLVNYGYIIGEKIKGEKAINYQVTDRLFCQFYRMRYLRQQRNTRLTVLADLLADTILFKDQGWQSFLDNSKRYDINCENNRLSALQPLAAVVLDYNNHRSTSEAFAAANQLFELIASEPTLPTEACIRLFWIEFINIGVPFDLLNDILTEQRAARHATVLPLLSILSVWLDYLSTPAKHRAEFNKALDPDLIASFTALEQEISDEAKIRYGIESAQEPTSS